MQTFRWPGLPALFPPPVSKASSKRILLQPPTSYECPSLPLPAPNLSSPVPAFSFLVWQRPKELRMREANEWRVRAPRTPRVPKMPRAAPAPFLFLVVSTASPPLPPQNPPAGKRLLWHDSSGPGRRLMTEPDCCRKHRPPGRQGHSGARVSKYTTAGSGWMVRRESGAWALAPGEGRRWDRGPGPDLTT